MIPERWGHETWAATRVKVDRAGRIGLRLGDLLDGAYLDDHLPFLAAEQTRRLAAYGGGPLALDDLRETCERWAAALRDRIVDSYLLVREALARHDTIVLEGQLGAGRDKHPGRLATEA